MKKLTGIGFGVFLVCFACLCNPQAAIAAIRVVAYNTGNNPDDVTEDAWFSTVFSAIGDELVNGMAKRLDILVVSETDTGSSARLVDILNNLYGVNAYTAVTSSSVGGDRTGVVYDESTVTLLDHNDLTSLGTHPMLRAHFRPVEYMSPNSEFYVYAVHLKSGDSSSDKVMRASEAANLRSNADALGEGKHIIYAGDFNLLGSSEGAWVNMVASGNAQAFDTANSPGEWRDNEAFKSLHSQDPRTAMDDRFDFQFVSGEFLDGNGLDYIPNSSHVFGNNGTHTLNDSISTGTGASPTVLTALESASNHLPVVADYYVSGPVISDAELLDETEALAAKYFFEQGLGNGLPQDSTSASFSSIAATGFGLTAFTIMAERYDSSPSWIYSPAQLRERTNQILDTLIEIQNNQTVSEEDYGTHGLFYHFINSDGKGAPGSEVSTVDTALLFAGIITAGQYFGSEVKQKADQIVGNAEWAFLLKTPSNNFPSNNSVDYQFSHGWKPPAEILTQTWDRPTDEAILVSIIALASDPENTDFQKSLFSWPRIQRSYAGYEVVNSYFGSLFTYEFAHAWIDFEVTGKDKPQGIMPGVEGVDWWQNSVSAAKAARQFVIDHTGMYSSYGPDSWGLSAVQKPDGTYEGNYGALPTDSGTAFHDGTIAPYSSISTVAFFKDEDGGNLASNNGFRALRNFYDSHYWDLWGEYGPKDSFNSQNEFSGDYLGIDQGIIVAMIENYRTGFVWQQFLTNEQIKAALKKVFEYTEYTIGGAIYTDLGDPLTSGLEGVTVTVSGGQGTFEATTSGAQGLWQMDVPEGTYTVTPSKSGYGFEHIVSGQSDGLGSITIEVNLANQAQNQSIEFLATSGGTSQYSLTASVVGVNGSVSPTSGTYADGTVVDLTATPDTGYQVKAWIGTDDDSSTANTNTVTMNSNKTVTVEFEPLSTVAFASADSSGPESTTAVNLAVSLSPASGRPVTVDYSVTAGTATGGGVDYTLAAGTLTFDPGETAQNIEIEVIDDPSNETDETIVITLSNPTNARLGANTVHTYTINDNDAAPTIDFTTASSSGSEAVGAATLAVNLSKASVQTVTVDYSVTGGTAIGGGVDYTLASGTLTFSPGDTIETIAITIVDDSQVEGNETVIVTLSNPVNATLGTNVSHTYTIVNDYDETPPAISGCIPDQDSIQAARDTIIQMHITDLGSGVEYNGGTVTIQVEGDLIYDGANESPEGVYDSTASSQAVKGVCRRTGTAVDYTFVFQPSTLFDYEQKVDVVVSATDKVGNATTETYYFYTVMRQFGKNIKVNSDTGTLLQNRPATAADSAGNIWVVWDQTTATADTDIYIGRLQVGASTFDPSTQVTADVDYQSNPAIAIDNDDAIYVVWQGDDLSGKWDIFVSSSVDGTSWSTPTKVNGGDPNNESDQTSPAIAIDGNNKTYVVWEDEQAGNKDIWMATSTNGTTWTPRQITTDANDQTEPAIATDADNVAYIVWTDSRNLSTTGSDIYGAASDNAWQIEQLVIAPGNQSGPAFATEPVEIVHFLWVDDASSYDDIFYANDISGFPLTGTSIIDEPNTIQSDPAIAVTGAGSSAKVFACWRDARNVSNNNGDTDIYYAESGSGFGTNILVNDDVGLNTQAAPDIGLDRDGNPYLVWVDHRSGNADIYYAGATAIGQALPTTTTTTGEKTIVELNGANAGYVDDATDVLVEIPAGATPSDITVTIAEIRNLPELPAGAFGVYYDFGPSGLQLSAPATITIPHAAGDCPALPIYQVYWYNTQIAAWSTTGVSNVKHLDDTAPNIAAGLHAVQFDITHFTTFGAGAGAVPGGGDGGDGCSLSQNNRSSVVGFLLPYVAFIMVLLVISWIDARRRRTRHESWRTPDKRGKSRA